MVAEKNHLRCIGESTGLYWPSLKIPIFVLLKSLLSVNNRKILLNFLMNLMPDRRQSVEYLVIFFFFLFFGFFWLLIYTCANFPEKDNKPDIGAGLYTVIGHNVFVSGNMAQCGATHNLLFLYQCLSCPARQCADSFHVITVDVGHKTVCGKEAVA